MQANKMVRNTIRNSGVKHWKIADYLGISENTFMRWLRTPLSPEKKERILEAVKKLGQEAE